MLSYIPQNYLYDKALQSEDPHIRSIQFYDAQIFESSNMTTKTPHLYVVHYTANNFYGCTVGFGKMTLPFNSFDSTELQKLSIMYRQDESSLSTQVGGGLAGLALVIANYALHNLCSSWATKMINEQEIHFPDGWHDFSASYFDENARSKPRLCFQHNNSDYSLEFNIARMKEILSGQ